jgi:hypothetical protein
VSEEELHRAALIGHEALAGIAPFLEMIEGFVAATRRNGFTEEQARAIVAYMFGYRPADGSTPEGAA